jgi:hypothetical protein
MVIHKEDVMKTLDLAGYLALSQAERDVLTARVDWNCAVLYMSNGVFHRVDGPAIVWKDKNRAQEYWFNGQPTTSEALALLKDMHDLKKILY